MDNESSQSIDAAKKKKRNKLIGTIIFVIFNIAVIAYTAISEFSGSDSSTKFTDIEIKWIYILPAFMCCLLAIVIETLKYALMMKRTCGFVNIKVCLETVLFGRYYDNITPSGVGGQPYQIYHMNKCGIPSAQSSAIPLAAFVSMQYGFVILAIICFAAGSFFMKSDVMRIAGYFGILMYALFPTVILLFTFFPKWTTGVLNWGVKVLHKIKIIKDKEASIQKVEESVSGYVACIKEILKARGLAPVVQILGVIYHIFICSIPFFVIKAFGGEIGFITCFCTTVSIYAAITFIPTPGNMGAAEGSFYAVFSMLTSGYVFWGMITWRFFVCYIFIIAGLLVYVERAFTGKKIKEYEQ